MEVVKSRARKWGNSIGIALPHDVVERENIREGDEVEVHVRKASDVFAATWGALRGFKKKDSRPTDVILAEIDKELEPEDE